MESHAKLGSDRWNRLASIGHAFVRGHQLADEQDAMDTVLQWGHVYGAWRVRAATTGGFRAQMLQWGYVREDVEARLVSTRRHQVPRFNGATYPLRGEVGVDVHHHARRVASMWPRTGYAEKSLPACCPRCHVGNFNGAMHLSAWRVVPSSTHF